MTSYTVAGVLPADFQFAINAADFEAGSQVDIWTPMALNPQKLQRGTHPLRAIARFKPGVALARAQAELDGMGANMARLYPDDNRDKGITAVPLAERVTAGVRAARHAGRSDGGLAIRVMRFRFGRQAGRAADRAMS